MELLLNNGVCVCFPLETMAIGFPVEGRQPPPSVLVEGTAPAGARRADRIHSFTLFQYHRS